MPQISHECHGRAVTHGQGPEQEEQVLHVTNALLYQSQRSSADHKASSPRHHDHDTPDSCLGLPCTLMAALVPCHRDYTCGYDGYLRVENR